MLSTFVYAEQTTNALYPYVMSVYGLAEYKYIDKELVQQKLDLLLEEYNIIEYNNKQADAFTYSKEYYNNIKSKLDMNIDSKIDSLINERELLYLEIENNILSNNKDKLSKLLRESEIISDDINDLLEDKTNVFNIFNTNLYEKIDTSNLIEDIEYNKDLIGSNDSIVNKVDLGNLDNLKRPFNYNTIVTSNAGYREDPINGKILYHNATDYAMPVGTELYSVFNGKVILSGNTNNGYGENIKIDCGDGIILHYAHLSERYVEVGDYVNQNDLIGLSGNTGRSTGPHLHLGLEIDNVVYSIEELFK